MTSASSLTLCSKCADRATHSCASISDDGTYRWELHRRWASECPVVLWVMLNPSTADGDKDDATLRRCIAFSTDWGFAGLAVANLFALRARHPGRLTQHADPVGKHNDTSLARLSATADLVVAAWGSHPMARSRLGGISTLLGANVKCLGLTGLGQPRHPLYLSRQSRLEPWHAGSSRLADGRSGGQSTRTGY